MRGRRHGQRHHHRAPGLSPHPRATVVVGAGQVTWPAPPSPEPVDLLAEAARLAAADAGAPGLLGRLDSIRVVNLLSRGYPDPAALVAERLGASPRQRVATTAGGNTPQVLVNRTAADIAAGHLDVALIGGAESWRTRSWYRRRGEHPPWTDQDPAARPDDTLGEELRLSSPEEEALGLRMPVELYPQFEVALAVAAGRTVGEQRARAAELWARFARVAAANPHAAIRTAPGAAEIATPTAANRVIGWPYTKLMCSNNAVDQAAALLVCSVEAARAAGVPPERWVFLRSGADASDVTDVCRRDRLDASPAIRAVGRATFGLAGAGPDDVELVDLYSCFPSAVQVAAAELGLDPSRELTVTGGLTFAGGPWNDYVTHAIATMAGLLRERPGALGLVTANGGNLTKHAAGLYSTEPPEGRPALARPQAEVDAVAARTLDAGWVGPAALEAWTVLHGRDGAPEVAYAYGRTPSGARALGASRDGATLAALADPGRTGGPADWTAPGAFAVTG